MVYYYGHVLLTTWDGQLSTINFCGQATDVNDAKTMMIRDTLATNPNCMIHGVFPSVIPDSLFQSWLRDNIKNMLT